MAKIREIWTTTKIEYEEKERQRKEDLAKRRAARRAAEAEKKAEAEKNTEL